MNPVHDILVYRPLQPESAAQISELQNEFASVRSFEPVDNPNLTIFDAKIWRMMTAFRLQTALNYAPQVSKQTFESEIVKAEFGIRDRNMPRFAINLVLGDGANNPFNEEHKRFKKGFEKLDPKLSVKPFNNPHVTIGHIESGYAIESILDKASPLIGQQLHIGKTESNVGTV